MSDITMCLNDGCPKRESCYRYIAEEDAYAQSYCNFKYDDENGCKWFWGSR